MEEEGSAIERLLAARNHDALAPEALHVKDLAERWSESALSDEQKRQWTQNAGMKANKTAATC
jgi:hypothetical protein